MPGGWKPRTVVEVTTSPKLTTVLDLLITEGVQVLHDQGMPPGMCIRATRIAIDVLIGYGFDFVPSPTALAVMPPGQPLSTAIGFGGGRFGRDPATRAYDGHLVAMGKGVVVDLTLHQLNLKRPAFRLRPTWFVARDWRPGGHASLRFPGAEVHYWPMKDRTYRETGAWRRCEETVKLTGLVRSKLDAELRRLGLATAVAA